jgi:phenylalanyl-tRNA synthetase beta chain
MKISYNWLKWYIPEAPEADKLADILTYHVAEVEIVEKLPDGDSIFDINILPNRAHDLLSHQGVARELASLLNIGYVDPTPKYKTPPSKPTKLEIEIKTKKCRRHIGRIVRNIKVGPSPEWVVKHLESIGQKSINNIVDATNIVMFDCGQPTHAFDLDKVKNSRLVIKDATKGQKITLLGGATKELNDNMLVIADEDGNALDIAGIKGGQFAELTMDTTNIILESDNFDPVFSRKTGQALNIFTDARKRFENDLSPELAPYAMRELSALIMEMCPDAVFEDIVDIYPEKQEIRKLSFSADKTSKILGLNISVDEIKDILDRYNFEYTENSGVFEITVPVMRLDLTIEEDMAEEIGRILGYDKVKPKIPEIDFKPKENGIYKKISWARSKLLSDGYSEVMTYIFRDKGEVEVEKSASDKKFLRTNLTDGLKESLKLNKINAPLLGLDEIKIFEIGTVFKKSGEEMCIAHGDKKEIKEMTLEKFISQEGKNFVALPASGLRHEQNFSLLVPFRMWSLFPFIARDVAVWVGEDTKSEDVVRVIKENMGDMVIRGPELFDEFKKPASTQGGDGKISYAFRLVFQSYERTLTDAEVNTVMDKITEKIKENNYWQVR